MNFTVISLLPTRVVSFPDLNLSVCWSCVKKTVDCLDKILGNVWYFVKLSEGVPTKLRIL